MNNQNNYHFNVFSLALVAGFKPVDAKSIADQLEQENGLLESIVRSSAKESSAFNPAFIQKTKKEYLHKEKLDRKSFDFWQTYFLAVKDPVYLNEINNNLRYRDGVAHSIQ